MTYCPDHDPILTAGYLICGSCKQRSYPVDAEWVTDQLILASFEQAHAPGCPNRHMATAALIDLAADDTAVPPVPRPRICRGTVRLGDRKGQPCRKAAAAGSAYCHIHQPDREAAR